MKKRTLTLILALCLSLSLLASCGAPEGGGQQEDPAGGSETVLFTDSLGREVAVPVQIDKIAVSGPLAQVMVFALAPELLVGLAMEWDNSAEQFLDTEYYNLPMLGQLYGGKSELNLEELLAAAPQVIIDIGEPKEGMAQDMDDLQAQTGIPFVHIDAATTTYGQCFRTLGQLLNKNTEAETLAAYCDETYAEIKGIADQISDRKVRLIYCLGDRGINVIAAGSYHAELMDLLGDNLAVVESPTAKGTGNEVDLEQIMMWNPDVILFAPDSIYDTVGDNPDWQTINAIKNGTYYEVPFGPYNWLGFPPATQRYLGMLWLSDLLYPDVTEYDLYTEVSEYFELFYHSSISQEQFDALLVNSMGK